ncbi:MAG: aldehyde ferredoxin oxidoreductase family protein [Deltaproteobacteria bacterium]|nr:MAG: aldehyde ferredoxin oxidoreductase family protein [Deltaproteobacteria bacterium]
MALFGRILDLDLSKGKWTFSLHPKEMVWQFLGGRGFNVWFLHQHIPPRINPMGSENILTLSCGLLTGTEAPVSSRLHINALSPLTGILGSSNVGGGFGAKLRSCEIQSLVIRGRAPTPVYLWIDRDTVETRNAQNLWGLDTWDTDRRLKEELGDEDLKILAIGPGGENGCLFACIMSDLDHAAGRTGMGAVMGSKNLKAIVARGQKRPKNETSSNERQAVRNYVQQMRSSPQFETLSTYGGTGYVKWADDMGILATRNYRQNRFEAVDSLDGKQLRKYVIRSRGCNKCPIQCKAELQFGDGSASAARFEFEPMISLGSKCALSDLETVVRLDNLCSRLGIDNISAGSAIAFAMDLYERGILTPESTGGIDLSWGNAEAMETLIRQMVYGDALGAVLAKGVRRAADIIGRGAERYAPHVKGLELAGYHPYHIIGTALGYTVSSRGADFNDVFATLEYGWSPDTAAREFGTAEAVKLNSIHGKAQLVRRSMLVNLVLDCLGLCKVPALSLIRAFDLEYEADLAAALTGEPVDAKMLFETGERLVNMERLFNVLHGVSSADDRLPDMFFDKEYNFGREPSQPFEWMEPMKQEFYEVMGWDQFGRPTEQKLRELDLCQYAPSICSSS